MTVPERIKDFICGCNASLCDDCIARKLNLKNRHQSQKVTRALGYRKSFVRQKSVCMSCGEKKLVVRFEGSLLLASSPWVSNRKSNAKCR
jgi:hypothetical protein